jgi:hypothetical protein
MDMGGAYLMRKLNRAIIIMSQQEPTEAQKQQYLAQVRQQANQQFVQSLLHEVTDGCTTKCMGSSGEGLSGSEKT